MDDDVTHHAVDKSTVRGINLATIAFAKVVHDYVPPNCRDDIAVFKGEKLFIIGEHYEDICYVKKGERKGFVPKSALEKTGDCGNVAGLFDVDRKSAERMLFPLGNPCGTFIIRPASDSESLALSLRYSDREDCKKMRVKHYKIIFNFDKQSFQIEGGKPFKSLQEMIEHHKAKPDGLRCKLSVPCTGRGRPPVRFRDLEIDRKNIELIERIGSGKFGEVWRGKWNRRLPVAVKMMIGDSMEKREFLEEAKMMHQLSHQNVVQIMAICTSPIDKPVWIVFELLKTSLLTLLREDYGKNLKWLDLVDIMLQICDGMIFLTKNFFVHRDLRSANCLVGENNITKVGDFGLAKYIGQGKTKFVAEPGSKFPTRWTAPEAAKRRIYSFQSDVWSYGCLLFEIITFGQTPFKEVPVKEIIDRVIGGLRLTIPHNVPVTYPKELYEIMQSCWHEHPGKRPTFEVLYEQLDSLGNAKDLSATYGKVHDSCAQ